MPRDNGNRPEPIEEEAPTAEGDKAPAPAGAAAAPKKAETVEDHAKAAGTPAWTVAAVKAHEGWPIGKELPREKYDAAVKKVLNVRIGY